MWFVFKQIPDSQGNYLPPGKYICVQCENVEQGQKLANKSGYMSNWEFYSQNPGKTPIINNDAVDMTDETDPCCCNPQERIFVLESDKTSTHIALRE